MAPLPTIRCVHCQMRLARCMAKYRLAGDTELFSLVERSVHPRNISEDDVICQSCRAQLTGNTTAVRRELCLACGKSIKYSRRQPLHKATESERDIIIRNVVAEWIAPQQVSPCDEICMPCWLRARIEAIRRQQTHTEALEGAEQDPAQENADQSNSQDSRIKPETNVQESDEKDVKHCSKPEDVALQIEIEMKIKQEVQHGSVRENYAQQDGAQDCSENSNNQASKMKNDKNHSITLPNLRRAADTASRCVFFECKDSQRHRVPDVIRKRILKDFNFYIPHNARICRLHSTGNYFHELYAAENAMSTFTAAHIEEMVLLSETEQHLDFSHPESIPDHLFEYWFGRTKQEYQQMLSDVPRLNDSKIKCGLSALLCKMRTGDTDERIAALFQMSRTTMESYMKRATEILLEDYSHSGFNFEEVLIPGSE